jgi:hypothetical protein
MFFVFYIFYYIYKNKYFVTLQLRDFLWGGIENEFKFHLVNWLDNLWSNEIWWFGG